MLKIYMFKTILKFIFAFALLYWLISSGKLDLSLIPQSFKVGQQWIFALLLILTQIFIGAYRYKLLLETKSQKTLRFYDILRLNYIGLFFSTVLPGAVTGDFIKLVYIKKLDNSFSKTFLLTITLLDRIMGLLALLFWAGIFSLIYFQEVTALSPKLIHVITLNYLLFSGTLFFLALLVSPEKFQLMILSWVEKIPLAGNKISIPLKQVFSLREKRKDLFKSFLISLIIQFIAILAFWVVSSPFLQRPLPFQFAFTFIPAGLIAMAVPISPGGLGVGHILFANLFSLVHISNGASLFNLFYLCNLVNGVIGVIPYLTIGRKQLD